MTDIYHSCVAVAPVCAQKRVPFDRSFIVIGQNWASASFQMHVRLSPGDTSSPLISLGNAAAGSQGISATYDAAYPMPDGSGNVAATIIRARIDEATIEGFALASPSYQVVQLYYDILVTPVGADKIVLCGGVFSIEPGVTI